MTDRRHQHGTPTRTDDFVIQIPATDFSPKPKPSPPPRTLVQRQLRQQHQRTSSKSQPQHPADCPPNTSRLEMAAANRAAVLHSTKARCRKHSLHVHDVVNAVRESRSRIQMQRAHALHDQLAKAATRRSLIRQARHHPTYSNSNSLSYHQASPSPGRIHFSSKNNVRRATSTASFNSCSSSSTGGSSHRSSSSHSSSSNSSMNSRSSTSTSSSSGSGSGSSGSGATFIGERSSENDGSRLSVARLLAANFLLRKATHLLTHQGLYGPTLHGVSFETLADRILSSVSVMASHYILRAVLLLNSAELKHVSSSRPAHIQTRDCRVILSAFVLGNHPSVAASTSSATPTSAYDHMGVVADARMLLFSIHLAQSNAPLVASSVCKWLATFKKWKETDVRDMVSPLIDKVLSLHRQRLQVLNILEISNLSDHLASTRQNNSHSLPSSSSVENEDAVDDAEAMFTREETELRTAIQHIAGPSGTDLLEEALQRDSLRRKCAMLHEVLLEPDSLAKRLCSHIDASTTLKDDSEPQVHTRLAWASFILNGMVPGCFQPDNDGDIVEQLYRAIHACQPADHDASLLAWRRSMHGARSVAEAVRTGCQRVAAVYKEFVAARVLIAHRQLDANRDSAYASEAPLYRRASIDEWLRQHSLPTGHGHELSVRDVLYAALVHGELEGELLRLDAARLRGAQEEFRKCCLAVALANVARNCAVAVQVLDVYDEADGEVDNKLLQRCVLDASAFNDDADRSVARGVVERILADSEQHPVYNVVSKRLREALLDNGPGVNAASIACIAPSQVRGRLAKVGTKLRDIALYLHGVYSYTT